MTRFFMRGATLILLGVVTAGCASEPVPTPAEISAAILADTELTAQAQQCPANLMDREELAARAQDQTCDAADWRDCLDRCRSGSAAGCYGLAQSLQAAKPYEAAVDVLFHRACTRGFSSGCTNYAVRSSMKDDSSPETITCALNTFERACALDDPWGCTMFAFRLTQQDSSSEARTRALAALEGSCKNGTDDLACVKAKPLRDSLLRSDSE